MSEVTGRIVVDATIAKRAMLILRTLALPVGLYFRYEVGQSITGYTTALIFESVVRPARKMLRYIV